MKDIEEKMDTVVDVDGDENGITDPLSSCHSVVHTSVARYMIPFCIISDYESEWFIKLLGIIDCCDCAVVLCLPNKLQIHWILHFEFDSLYLIQASSMGQVAEKIVKLTPKAQQATQ